MDVVEKIQELLWGYLDHLAYTPTKWYFVLSCFCLATICYFVFVTTKSKRVSAKSFFNFLFPKDIYLHRSTKNDLLYVLSLPVIGALIFLPALALSTSGIAFKGVTFGLNFVFGIQDSPANTAAPMAGILFLLTVCVALASDFFFYLHHYFFHRIQFLWEFHKVHHSAEVLTPLTDFRAHPIELYTYGAAQGIGFGVVQGIFVYVTNADLSVLTIMGLNAIFFFYYIMGYALRHSHFWISYGPILSHVFISPAQHQIHHSCDPKHWNRNFGGAFALWDWMFGTLYIPKEKEELKFGLDDSGQQEFDSISSFYIQPFAKNMKSTVRKVLVISLVVCIFFYAFKSVYIALAN